MSQKMIITEEPDIEESPHQIIKRMKELTGNDSFHTRILHKTNYTPMLRIEEPYEILLKKYNLQPLIFFKYCLRYDLVKKIFEHEIDYYEMNDIEFMLVEDETTRIIEEIIELEKQNNT